MSFIQSTNLPQDLQDDLLFTARTASDGIRSWKTHQLRMVHQDTARTDIVDSIQEGSVLITQDFAMKFLPAHYRETQAVLWKEGYLMALDSLSEQAGRGARRSNFCAHN